MFTPTSQNQRSRCHRDDYGKCIPFSIPFHRLGILNDVERNMHMDQCPSRSHYLRKLIDKDTAEKNQKLKEARMNGWQSLVGSK